MTAAAGPADAETEVAIGWLVTLNSGAVSAAEQAAFARWLAQAPAHRAAWQRLSVGLGPLAALRARPLEPAPSASATPSLPGARPGLGATLGGVMQRAETRLTERRRLLRGSLALGGVAVGAGLLWADRQAPLSLLATDARTGTAERRTLDLPDGSQLTLDARSGVDFEFSASRRLVRLRAGALLAQVVAAGAGDPPFVVQTAHGRVQALGTRFMVRLLDADGPSGLARTQVAMLAHDTRIEPAQGESLRLAEGRSAEFDTHGARLTDTPAEAAAAWHHGMLQVHDESLATVIDRLRPYRRGFMRVSPQVAALRVYGSYDLQDTDRALQALMVSLPIQVREYQRGWLVVVEPATG